MPSIGLQIVRILHRLFIGVFYKPCIAAKGVCYDDLLFFHKVTSAFLKGEPNSPLTTFPQ